MATSYADLFPPPVYNESLPNGGNPLEMDVNAVFQGYEYHYVFQVIMGCLVFLIVPGIGLLYGGMARRKSALAMIFQSIIVMAVVSFQWMFWGFSIAFSRTGGPFIGDLSAFGLRNVLAAPSFGSAVLPDIVFCFYELMFAACATMIVVGGSFERGRIVPSILFSFIWCTIAYCPIAFWTWNPNGWLFKFGALDFAGGGPVHISSGSAGLAYALLLGKRSKYGEKTFYKPHNVTIVFLGTVLIWFGWFGFNGGSALNASVRSMVAIYNTNTAASTGVLGWTLFGYIRHKRKFSVIGACEGAIAGLVGVTPAAGYVSVWAAAAIGFITAIVICCFENVNEWLGIDDGLEVFKLHGIGGMVGAFLTGCFASASVSSLDGIPTIASGAIDGNGVQIGRQLAEICAIASYSFTVSFLVLLIMKYIPGLHLRVTDEVEMIGYDVYQFNDEIVGEWALFESTDEKPKGDVTHGVEVDEHHQHGPSSSTSTQAEKIEEAPNAKV
ncbi:ammonium transporter [Microthyrium microscopicum]|uniref:Ammonium transporter n=1 Tax=Microthyrium microscopicum TaxID=703497 RepID=A0A6A6UDQ9_9PEZI|nr:ammonium transporter [Microthyrium microscopicum]